MRLFHYFLMFVFGANALCAQVAEKHKEHSRNSGICISETEQNYIEAQIAHNVDSLRKKGILLSNNAQKSSSIVTSLQWPVTYVGTDCNYYNIGNYVDQDPTTGILDYNCGQDTYDGHQGIDIDTWPYGWYKMDSNLVHVVAAADGVIVAKLDGQFDRSCTFNNNLPNYVIIEHADGSRARYLHMKNGTITTLPIGTSVTTGTYLGIMGSSGSSTYPHLHFEIRDANNAIIEPFYKIGGCNNYNPQGVSWWQNQEPPIRPVISSILTGASLANDPFCPIVIDTLNAKSCFIPNETFYIDMRGNDGNNLPVIFTVKRPNGTPYVYNNYVAGTSAYEYWRWYYTLTIPSSRPDGVWTIEASIGESVCTKNFTFLNPSISGITSICSGTSTTLTASSGSMYVWSTGATNNSISVSSAGTYTVTVTSEGGCTATATQVVSILNNPTATISGANSICSGGNTTLTASGGGTYAWNTGATGSAISVSSAGTYTVTVTSEGGCTATAAVTVSIVPTATISGANSICSGTNTTLTASGGGTYAWNTGATGSAISVSSAGTYTVTVTNANGCTATATRVVSVLNNPTATISGTNSICSGANTTLTASGGGTYAWNTGATGSAISVSSAGTYTVTVTNANGCTATATRVVSVLNNPTATISGTNSICSGANTTLTASGGGTYAWNTGATGSAISVSSAGTYTVTVTNANGCTATATRVVSVLNNPTATISGANSICSGANTTLTASGGGTYAWNTGSTGSAISVSSAGTYTVTVTNANGCTATATRVVSVLNNPTATISGANSICSGANTTFTASGGGTYAWNTSATGSAISVSSAGTYTVTVTNANGCTATATRVVSVLNNPTATISGANSICSGANTTLTASGGGTYAWNTGATGSAISVSSAGTYTVTVTNANGCTASSLRIITNGLGTPTNLTTTNITATSATLSWGAVPTAANYTILGRKVGTTNWITVGPVTGTSKNIQSQISACKTYEWKVRANCSDGLTSGAFSNTVQFTTLGCESVNKQNVSEWDNYQFFLSPNPTTAETTLHYFVDQPSRVCINVYDATGKMILIHQLETDTKGEQQYQLDTATLPKGIYMVQLQTDHIAPQTAKLIVQ